MHMTEQNFMEQDNITKTPSTASFYGLGIAPRILDILDGLRFVTPTPIQHKAIPIAIEGKDLIGIAQTGTGKTLAFGIPIIQRLAQIKGQGLVLLPTRELAMQVDEVLRLLGRSLGLRTALLIGGAGFEPQISALRSKPHVVIATPGRLIDHMERRNFDPMGVHMLVLDEADRMLDMGFLPQLRIILGSLPKERQTMLFSATMPDDIVHIASKYMRTPVRTEIAPPGTAAENVTHELFIVDKADKVKLLEKLLEEYRGTVLVFLRTKYGAKKVCMRLRGMHVSVAEIHSNRSLAQRRDAMEGFKKGKYRVLVATDIASRGIDVSGIELVVNFDIPENPHDYIHRIGRTGRAGLAGHAISMATPDQGEEVRAIEKLSSIMLPITRRDDMPAPRQCAPAAPMRAPMRSRRPFAGRRVRRR
jgi:ATP-dependent RNA helicase RhlE